MTTEAGATVDTTDHGHSHCLLCGHLNPRSLNLHFQPVGADVVEAEFQGRADLRGYDDILHGGVIAAFLDAAMTHCLFHKGIQAVTGDLHVRFVTPISCESILTIRAWILSSRPPLYYLRSEITVDRHVMAWAEAKFIQRRIPGKSPEKVVSFT